MQCSHAAHASALLTPHSLWRMQELQEEVEVQGKERKRALGKLAKVRGPCAFDGLTGGVNVGHLPGGAGFLPCYKAHAMAASPWFALGAMVPCLLSLVTAKMRSRQPLGPVRAADGGQGCISRQLAHG